MRNYITLFLLAGCLSASAVIVAGIAKIPSSTQGSPRVSDLPYHDQPPTEPLPATLDPVQFQSNRAAFVAYTLAAQIKETLYQVPCYCPCRKMGHQSLLDCFSSQHGVACTTCQKEAVFCYLQHKKGNSPARIRQGLANGEAAGLDLAKFTNRLYTKIQNTQR